MICAAASCGHFALFDDQEQLLTQVCRCADPVYVPPGTAPVAHAVRKKFQRHTTSSRKPGRNTGGKVLIEERSAVVCSKCKGEMMNAAGIHGYRRTAAGPVDCMDQPVEVAHG